jgi:hypothetical protein
VMVGPGWVRNPNQWWELLVYELESHSERTGAAQWLDGDDSAWFDCFTVFAEDQSLGMGIETNDTINGDVLLKVTLRYCTLFKEGSFTICC